MNKMLFVFNPRSGKGQIGHHLLQITDIFTKAGYEVTVHPTQAQLDAYRYIMKREKDFDVIVCSGGDGTLNEAIRAFMELGCKKNLGYIPAGTMNDFASTLGIPKDMPKAAQTIVESLPVAVDIGSFGDEYFTYVAAFGVFTSVSYGTDQQLKNSFGVLAYVIGALKAQQEINQTYHLKVKYDDVVIEDDFIFGMIANSMSVGGIKGLAGTDVWLDDGIFEGLLIRRPKTFIELQQIINSLLRHDFSSPYIYYFKSNHFEFESQEEVAWTIDGEFGGNHKNVTIDNRHCAVNVYSGRNRVTIETPEISE